MLHDWNTWGSLALSMVGAVAGVSWAVLRVWRLQRRFAPQHPNAATGRWFAMGFGCAALLWLAWALHTGYAHFWQSGSDRLWLLAVHADALWSIPLFISAVVWAASVAMGWVFRLLQRQENGGTAPR